MLQVGFIRYYRVREGLDLGFSVWKLTVSAFRASEFEPSGFTALGLRAPRV